MELKSKLYAKVITLPGFYTAFRVAFSTAVDISDDEGGMAVDIFFKPRVEATEQMAQNCMDISQSKNQRAQNRVQVTCIITVCSRYFLFQLYFTPEDPS